MAHTVVGKLNKAANEFQIQDGVGFGIRLGVQYYDRETKKKEWTNYEAVIFAKQQQQIDFYRQVLTEGSVVEISGDSLKIKQFNGQNGLSLSLEIINARLGYVHAAQQAVQQQYAAPQQQYAPQQPQYQQPAPQPGYQQPMQQPQHPAQVLQANFQQPPPPVTGVGGMMDIDDEIPF